jgi:hypothetical protein
MEAMTQVSPSAGTRMYLQYGNSLEGFLVQTNCIALAVVLAFLQFRSYYQYISTARTEVS